MATSTVTRKAARQKISQEEREYLLCGLSQPGGKLPLFDDRGQEINPQVIQACLKKGFAERWFANPIRPNWLVCRLTDAGRKAAI